MFIRRISLVAVILSGTAFFAMPTLAAPEGFTIVEAKFSAKKVQVSDFNDNGEITGTFLNGKSRGEEWRVFKWSGGRLEDLGWGYHDSRINNSGKVAMTVGHYTAPRLAVVKGRSRSLMRFSAPLSDVMEQVSDINSQGIIVGGISARCPRWTNGPEGCARAFAVIDGKMRDLGDGKAAAVNDDGLMVGADEKFRVWTWQDGVKTDLGFYGLPFDINKKGTIIGLSRQQRPYGSVTDSFIWENGERRDLDGIFPYSINDEGIIVGAAPHEVRASAPAYGGLAREHAMIWKNGELADLNDFLPDSSDIELYQAIKINNAGQILAAGLRDRSDVKRYFIVTVPDNLPPKIKFERPREEWKGTFQEDFEKNIYSIAWENSDPEGGELAVSLYYDTNRGGADGTLIASGLRSGGQEKNNVYQWDVSKLRPDQKQRSLPEAQYYIYAVVEDGVNHPQIIYAEQPADLNSRQDAPVKIWPGQRPYFPGYNSSRSKYE